MTDSFPPPTPEPPPEPIGPPPGPNSGARDAPSPNPSTATAPVVSAGPGVGSARPTKPRWLLPAVVVVALIVGIVVIIETTGKDDKGTTGSKGSTGQGEIFTEPKDSVGPTPFTPPVVTTNPAAGTTSTSAAPTTTLAPTTTMQPATSTSGASSTTAFDASSTSAPTSTVAGATTTVSPTTVSPTTGAGPTTATNTPPTGTQPGAGTGGRVPTVVQTVPGNSPGLYGGTRNDRVCDADQLVSFLESTPDKAAAWAGAQGIDPSQIRDFVSQLTPVLLRADTRVTNFGYENGRATMRQVVLQAGTAVFVDVKGVPRVRCKCGNPLAEPVPVQGPTTYTGTMWPGFDPGNTQVVTPSPTPIVILVIVDTGTGGTLERPLGPTGGGDVIGTALETTTTAPVTIGAPTTTAASTTTALPTTIASTTITDVPTTGVPTTTAVPTTTVPPPIAPVNIVKEGSLAASSSYPGGLFPQNLAIDGDVTTSWFSAGDSDPCPPIDPGVSCSRLSWVHGPGEDVLITEIDIINNAQNADPANRHGFGFGSVNIKITNVANATVYDVTTQLPGDDADLFARINVKGYIVSLTFEGHDSPDCGGISEFRVLTQ